jgi:flagellar biosynthesis/type III secretory pathway M-ring protein FliF/YscJ
MQKYVKDMSPGMLIGIGLGALIILIAPVLLLRMRKRKSTAVHPTADRAVDAGDEADFEGQLASRVASQERLDAEALHALKLPAAGTKKSEVLAKHLKKAVKDDPAASAQLLRTWIHENET